MFEPHIFTSGHTKNTHNYTHTFGAYHMIKQYVYTMGIVILSFSGSLFAEITLSLELDSMKQVMKHFGSSAAFNLNEITENSSDQKKDAMAKLIFSTETDGSGNPNGLGLSSFRIEIGACSKDLGDGSQISSFDRRADCPLRSDGSYDWHKMEAETYWIDKAYEYDLETVIAYSNAPPIYYSNNGLACRTDDIPAYANLKDEHYDDFAEYLSQVALYYQERETPLHFLSPVNEPQWEWFCWSNGGQEGSEWSTTQIKDLTVELNDAFVAHDISTKILLSEAGSIDWVYSFFWDAKGHQTDFWTPGSDNYVGDLPTVSHYVAGHGYWTEDSDDRLISTREALRDKLKSMDHDLEWWQTEYSFLGSGFDNDIGGWENINYGLWLSKVIHHDLTVGDASAWQYWETFDGNDLKYKLASTNNNGGYLEITGYALAHYSFFIRPGMQRITLNRSDNATLAETVDGVLPSAFINRETGEMVFVVTNYTGDTQTIALALPQATQVKVYQTTSSENLRYKGEVSSDKAMQLPAKSISTFVLNALPIRDALLEKESTMSSAMAQDSTIGDLSSPESASNTRSDSSYVMSSSEGEDAILSSEDVSSSTEEIAAIGYDPSGIRFSIIENEFVVYADNSLNLLNISIVDVTGKRVKTVVIDEHMNSVSVSSLDPGAYFVVSRSTQKSIIQSFIKSE